MSEVLKENDELRIDSEYLLKEYTENEKLIKQNEYKLLGDMSYQITDFGAYSQTNMITFYDKGILFLRNQDVKDTYLSLSDNVFITQEVFNKLTLKLQKNDIVIPRVGTLGNAAIITENHLPCTANQNLAVIRLKKEFNPYYVTLVLSSSLGRTQIFRTSTGNVQQWLNLGIIKKLKIPILPDKFQKEIECIVKNAHSLLEQSKKDYKDAESLLLESLGVEASGFGQNDSGESTKRDASSPNCNIKKLSQSFMQTGRLDAEYYQSKYDRIEEKFNNFERIKLSELVNYPISSGATPKAGGNDYTSADEGIPFVRAVDLIEGEVSTENFIYIKQTIHNGMLKRTRLQKGDVLFSIAGTVGRAAEYLHSFEANINQAIAILRFDHKIVNSTYLTLFFNSNIGKVYVSKFARQGVQTNLNLEEVGSLSIPLLPHSTQEKIASLVQSSFAKKNQSKALLQKTKSMVEQEIEK